MLVGEKAVFSVTATGKNLSYQWQYSTNGTTWNNSVKTAAYSITANLGHNGMRFRCIVSDGTNSVTSKVALLHVSNMYTVTFDANGGYWDTSSVTTKSYEVTPGDKFTNYPSKPMHKTLTFKGWYYDKECKNEVGYAGFYPEKDMTVYAGWDEKVTVTFDANGGKVGNNKDTMQQVIAKGSTIENMPTATREDNYSFAGWALTKNATADEVIDFFHYVFDKDTYLYAVWTENYIITYDTNGGKWSIEDTTCRYGVKPGESLGSPTYKFPGNPICEGKAFTGWYHDKEGKNKIDNIYQYVPTSSETLYAGWTEDYYTITLIAKGGTAYADSLSGETVKINVPKDQSINLRTGAVKKGYSFAGWSYDAEAKTIDFTVSQLSYRLLSGNITLYAAFGQQAKVTLNANGGQFYNGSDSINMNLTIGYPYSDYFSDPTREGYYFAGWSKQQDATEAEISSLQDYTPQSATETLYAVWKIEGNLTAPELEYDENTHELKITVKPEEKPYITIGVYKDGQLSSSWSNGQWTDSRDYSWYVLKDETKESGVYKFAVKASRKQYDLDFSCGKVTFTKEYEYTAPADKLATPINLHWDGTKATWSMVANTAYYKVTAYSESGNIIGSGTTYQLSYDFNWVRNTQLYQFTVIALPDNFNEYAASDESAKSPVYGESTEALYNVTFHAGPGVAFEGMGQNTISWKQEKGSKIENTPNPVKSGYFLVGWALTENGKPIDLSTYTVESDVDLYAVMGKQIQPASITYNPYTKTVMISSNPSDHYYIALRITSESQGVVHEHYFGQVPESGSITYDVSEYVTDATTYTFKTFTDESEEGAKRFGGVWSETQYTNDIVTTKLDTPTGLYWGMNAVANWNAVENADEYEVTLYKNGVKTDKVITTSELTTDFYTEVVGEDDTYTFTVKAITSDTIKYLNSDVSEASSECRGRDENELPIAPTMAQPNVANSKTELTESDDQKKLNEEDVSEKITDETAEDTENSESAENVTEKEQVDQQEKLQETPDVNEADSPSDEEDSQETDNAESESLEDGVQEEQ